MTRIIINIIDLRNCICLDDMLEAIVGELSESSADQALEADLSFRRLEGNMAGWSTFSTEVGLFIRFRRRTRKKKKNQHIDEMGIGAVSGGWRETRYILYCRLFKPSPISWMEFAFDLMLN